MIKGTAVEAQLLSCYYLCLVAFYSTLYVEVQNMGKMIVTKFVYMSQTYIFIFSLLTFGML